MLALILAAPFIFIVLIGIFSGIKRSIQAAQMREKFREDCAERRRAASLGRVH